MKELTITKSQGRWTFSTDLDSILAGMRNGVYTLIIKRKSEKRSIAQNDLMWLWFTHLENETGTPKEQIYNYYCQKFLRYPCRYGNKECMLNRTTSQLTTEEMAIFMRSVQADAATELGVQLPTPEDLHFEAFFQTYNKTI